MHAHSPGSGVRDHPGRYPPTMAQPLGERLGFILIDDANDTAGAGFIED